jgi:hypothetical protein
MWKSKRVRSDPMSDVYMPIFWPASMELVQLHKLFELLRPNFRAGAPFQGQNSIHSIHSIAL